MRKIAFAFLTLISLSGFAQKNVLHDPEFWSESPSIDRIKSEIAKGSSPSEAGPYGADAVVYAINAQSPMETIKFMLGQKGNDINKRVSNGRTYVYSAASRGNVELMEYLISKGAKMNLRDNFGYSVFTYAAASGQTNTKIYDICIREGADPKNEKITGGANALLLLAPLDTDFSLIDYFVAKGVDIKSVDSIGNTAFDYAVKSGNVAVLKKLVARGVKYSPDAMITASQGSRGTANTLELYQYLDELKLNPKALSPNGENVLHFIVRRPKQKEIISYFVAKGVDINQPNADGVTPFMNAAGANTELETLNMLLPLVKNINQLSEKRVSALAMAVRRNSVDAIKLLLDAGADFNVVDSEGYNLAFYLIPTYNAQRSEVFEAKLKLLQEHGFDIAKTQKNGSTLYHMVLVKNGIPLLKRIEAFKIDVNAKDKEGLTPLHKAAMLAEDDTILKYLLSIGARKETVTNFKETAFDLAKENEYLKKEHVSIDFLK